MKHAVLTSKALFDYLEIYPGSKTTHFRRLAEVTGIDFRDMCT